MAVQPACIDALRRTDIPALDITGGAPEMNPNFRWMVSQARGLGRHVIDRCNLTILLAAGFRDLPEFLAAHQVEIVASLPCYLEDNCDRQRGSGVFRRSIQALRRLNALGYGRPDSDLRLCLVYNPTGMSLPPDQTKLEQDYRRQLHQRYSIQSTRHVQRDGVRGLFQTDQGQSLLLQPLQHGTVLFGPLSLRRARLGRW